MSSLALEPVLNDSDKNQAFLNRFLKSKNKKIVKNDRLKEKRSLNISSKKEVNNYSVTNVENLSSEQRAINEHIFPVVAASEITSNLPAPFKAKYLYKTRQFDFDDTFEDCETLRLNIFSRHTSLSVMLANGYKQLHKFIGYQEAVDRLKVADDSLSLFDIKLSSDDSQLCDISDDKARACRLKVENLGCSYKTLLVIEDYVNRYTFQMPDFDRRYFEAEPFKRAMLPVQVKDYSMRCLEGCLNRVSDPIWWRRQLRSKQGVVVEQIARDLRLVHKKASPYVSNQTIYTRRLRKAKNEKVLSNLFLLGEHQSPFDELETLQSICEKSHTSGYQQACELMVRMRGTEELSQMVGHVADFNTITCPSRFHAVNAKGIPNKKYQYLSAQDAQAYLNNVWRLARAQFSKAKLKPYGFRVVEPHHDGCPHWHMLMFAPKEDMPKIRKILKDLALRDSPEEVKRNSDIRFKSIQIDSKQGSAVGYIAKYITKAITGANIDTVTDTLAGEINIKPADAAESAREWAGNNKFRQFDPFGLPSVTVWREMRRLGIGAKGQCEVANAMNKSVDSIGNFALEKVRQAADSSDWAAFVIAMGGVQVKRKDQAVRIHYQIPDLVDTITGEVSRAEGMSPFYATKYGDSPSNRILGVAWDNVLVITRKAGTKIMSEKEIKGQQKIMSGVRHFFEDWEDRDLYLRPDPVEQAWLESISIPDQGNRCWYIDYEALEEGFMSDEVANLDLCH
ncbi:replication endonuclease [Pseudoalteromonas denitrificans]|uniref:Bacteriophage replication gene A protein (GPA) n=1 Tax=Pseudoalteromonas denitrificans DSM 6059 TaxID=1123010 RepID=A0A1I1EUP8_9GAMM|nr:replication endonuclease [Pseudoalteromonas denitrificans]SFB90366.1 Bacteriophage replication gene A protein (GPA) [Pseudoalteromonas denitrificans DSM 6059]